MPYEFQYCRNKFHYQGLLSNANYYLQNQFNKPFILMKPSSYLSPLLARIHITLPYNPYLYHSYTQKELCKSNKIISAIVQHDTSQLPVNFTMMDSWRLNIHVDCAQTCGKIKAICIFSNEYFWIIRFLPENIFHAGWTLTLTENGKSSVYAPPMWKKRGPSIFERLQKQIGIAFFQSTWYWTFNKLIFLFISFELSIELNSMFAKT